jgi:S1-C subfamily serine protease
MRVCCLLLLLMSLCLGQDAGERPAPVDDPIGLGERLALIDYLRETAGQSVEPGCSLAELRRRYWQLQQESEESVNRDEALARDGLQRLREEIRRRFNVAPDDSLDLAGLQALKQQLIDESLAEVAEMAAADQAGSGGSQRPLDSVIEQSRAAVVMIATKNSTGSGFFISSNGGLLTNRHVCPTVGEEVRVFWDGSLRRQEQRFRVERISQERDCALLRPVQSQGPYPNLQRGGEGELGQAVIAFGFPLGVTPAQELGTDRFDISVNRGTITGHRRKGETIWFLQSDCAISQGNSGGPLVDQATGRVLGMVTSGLDPRDQGAHGSIMVFSIPIDSVLEALRF